MGFTPLIAGRFRTVSHTLLTKNLLVGSPRVMNRDGANDGAPERNDPQMSMYSITTDQRMVAVASGQAAENSDSFGSQEELATLTEHWPLARLVEIWNQLPVAKPVRRFTDRATAVRRLWAAVQGWSTAGQNGATAGARRASRRTKASKTQRCTTGRKGTKTDKILAMLRRPTAQRSRR